MKRKEIKTRERLFEKERKIPKKEEVKIKDIRQVFAPVSATSTAAMRNDKTKKKSIDSVIQIDWNKLDNKKI